MSLGAVCAQGFKKMISQLFPLVFSTEQQKGQADDYDWDLENENVYYIVDCPAIPATQYLVIVSCTARKGFFTSFSINVTAFAMNYYMTVHQRICMI